MEFIKKFLTFIIGAVAAYLLLVTDFMFGMYRDIGAKPNASWFVLLFVAVVLSVIFIFAFKRFYLDE